MTKFTIRFKGRIRPKTIEADGYFISDRDSSGYTRLVFYNNLVGNKKKHVLVCNANDTWYTKFD